MTSMTSRVERTRRDPEEVVANLVQRLAFVFYVCLCVHMYVSMYVRVCALCAHPHDKISLCDNQCHRYFHKSILILYALVYYTMHVSLLNWVDIITNSTETNIPRLLMIYTMQYWYFNIAQHPTVVYWHVMLNNMLVYLRLPVIWGYPHTQEYKWSTHNIV